MDVSFCIIRCRWLSDNRYSHYRRKFDIRRCRFAHCQCNQEEVSSSYKKSKKIFFSDTNILESDTSSREWTVSEESSESTENQSLLKLTLFPEQQLILRITKFSRLIYHRNIGYIVHLFSDVGYFVVQEMMKRVQNGIHKKVSDVDPVQLVTYVQYLAQCSECGVSRRDWATRI